MAAHAVITMSSTTNMSSQLTAPPVPAPNHVTSTIDEKTEPSMNRSPWAKLMSSMMP